MARHGREPEISRNGGRDYTDPPTSQMPPVDSRYGETGYASRSGYPGGDHPQPQQYQQPGGVPTQTSQDWNYDGGWDQPEKKSSGAQIVVIVTLIALLIAAVVVGGLILAKSLSSPNGAEDEAVKTSAALPSDGNSSGKVTATTTTTVTPSTDKDEPTSTETADAEPTVDAPRRDSRSSQPHFTPPAGADYVGKHSGFSVYRGSGVTTEPFSVETARSMSAYYRSTQPVDVKVYSPVTKQKYTMTCVPQKADGFRCSGGDNAVVYLVRK